MTRPASIVALVCGLILCVPVVPQALAICFGVFAIARQRLPDERVGAALAGTILGLLALLGWLAAWTFIPATGIFRPATGLPPGYVTARGYPGSTGAEEDWLRTSAWADTMERVYRSAAAYHRDYREWPADLESLEGAYLPNGFELSPAMTFRPVPSPEPAGGGWIMIVSDPTLYDRQGERLPKSHRLVLRLSGRIELLVAADVDGLLADQNGNAAP